MSQTQHTCPHCGGSLMGDGYTTPIHCERVSGSELHVAPDSYIIYCTGDVDIVYEPEPGDREPFFPAPHDPVQGDTLTPAQVADGWHYCPAFDGLLTRGENPSGTHCFCGHPNTSTGDTQ